MRGVDGPVRVGVPICFEDTVSRAVQSIVSAGDGAQALVNLSNDGWFGDYDKLTTSRAMMQELFGVDLTAERARYVFAGDSPNDAPMFGWFPNAVGVANVADFADRLQHRPRWITAGRSGEGFVELAEALLAARR